MKFPKKVLGKKLRTSMMCHRVSVKFYENGIVIKPIMSQVTETGELPKQEAIFLNNDSTEGLTDFLYGYKNAKEIVEELTNETN